MSLRPDAAHASGLQSCASAADDAFPRPQAKRRARSLTMRIVAARNSLRLCRSVSLADWASARRRPRLTSASLPASGAVAPDRCGSCTSEAKHKLRDVTRSVVDGFLGRKIGAIAYGDCVDHARGVPSYLAKKMDFTDDVGALMGCFDNIPTGSASRTFPILERTCGRPAGQFWT